MSVLALDTETHLIAPGVLVPRLVCLTIAWGDGDRPAWLPRSAVEHDGAALFDAEGARVVAPALLAHSGTLVAANAPYDLAVLARAVPSVLPAIFEALDEGRVSDVQVRQRLLACARGTLDAERVDLASLCRTWLGVDVSSSKAGPDVWRLRYAELDGVPLEQWPPAAAAYALDDARHTLGVWHAQRQHPAVDGHTLVDAAGRVRTEARELRAAWALHLMAAYGVRTDPHEVAARLTEWRATVEGGRAAGERGGWIRTDGRRAGTLDKKALQAVIVEALPGVRRTPSGQVATDGDTLVAAAERGTNADLRAYAASLTQSKALSLWGTTLEQGTTRPIVSRPKHLVATGRTSWSDPPWQQPPRNGGVRECVVPRPGYLLCSVDYHIAELCALAQLHIWQGLGDTMARAINAGRDLHIDVGAQILGIAYDECVRRYKAGDADARRARQLAKVANFGFPGGLGAARFVEFAASQGVHLDVGAAKELRATWLRAWPEMRGYFDWVARQTQFRDVFTYVHPVSDRVRGGVGYTDGCNGGFQGLVADGAKHAAWSLARAAYVGDGPLRGTRPILFIHDEIIAEVPTDTAHEAAEAMASIMISAMAEHIPDVPPRAEPALMRRWYKQAETVRDASRRLVPWEPRASDAT